MHFGISEGNGGLKHGSRPWLGMDIFWNCPIAGTSRYQVQHKTIKASDFNGTRIFYYKMQ